ncbi:MAG: hypothetical protein II893_06935 [Methanomicrobium sp.]|nr:hypothetical protein [Methanomicrobium sp.]MBQ3719107.1 hypothetical protein [Methanomicrobium sp.]MBQ4415124.1 hypothetical protein [Methanomicrobium sp.]
MDGNILFWIDIINFVIGCILFCCVLGGFFGITGILDPDNENISGKKRTVLGILIFGSLSVLGNLIGFANDNVLINFRDVGPIAGGLWFGPAVALGAAVMGATSRLFFGGATMFSCAVATIVAGAASAVIYRMLKGNMTVRTSVITAAILGAVHLTLVSIMTPNGIAIILTPSAIGSIVLVVFGVATFSSSYKYFGARFRGEHLGKDQKLSHPKVGRNKPVYSFQLRELEKKNAEKQNKSVGSPR